MQNGGRNVDGRNVDGRKRGEKENIQERVNYCRKLKPESIIDEGRGESDFYRSTRAFIIWISSDEAR